METAPDIFYPVIEAHDDNIELRYSLRSLSNTGHGRVIIVGHLPRWVRGVTHIPFSDKPKDKLGNVAIKELLACCESQAQEIVIMHDDVYILKKTTLGFYKRSQSARQAALQAQRSKRPLWVLGALGNIQKLFNDAQTAYTHVPHRVDRCRNIALYTRYDLINSQYLTCDVYLNQYKDHPWEPMEDRKVYDSPEEIIKHRGLFVSTGNKVARCENFKTIMDGLFPNKCKYEA